MIRLRVHGHILFKKTTQVGSPRLLMPHKFKKPRRPNPQPRSTTQRPMSDDASTDEYTESSSSFDPDPQPTMPANPEAMLTDITKGVDALFSDLPLDVTELGALLAKFVTHGSKRHSLSLEDLNIGLIEDIRQGEELNLDTLLKHGARLVDSVVWLAYHGPNDPPPSRDAARMAVRLPSMNDYSRAMFYIYFFLLTQARYPPRAAGGDRVHVAQILKNVFGMREQPFHYVDICFGFDPEKFDPAWVKAVPTGRLGQEALNRLGLGVAGYRLFAPFKLYNVKDDAPNAIRDAAEFARTVATAPPTWAIHPLTRNPDVLARRGNLNKNLANLILEAFTADEIAEMVQLKILPVQPVHEPRCKEYKRWSAEDDISGDDFIFRGH